MKFLNKKRVASTVLAGAMALTMAAPAFAAANETTVTGTYAAITLAVTVPTTGKAVINPYGLPYKLDDTTSISGQYVTTGAPLMVQNKSQVPLSVSASILTQEKGNFKFSATDATAETTTKGNVVFQMFPAAGITEDNAADTEVLNAKFAALKDDTEGHDATKDITLVAGTTAAKADDIIALKAGNADGELVDGGAAFFRLSGTVAKKATWATTDGFVAKIAFTFEPTTIAEPTPSAGTIASDAVGNLDTFTTSALLTLTPDLPSGVTVSDWRWTSSQTGVATVAEESDDTTATVTRVAAGTTTITVSGTGSDDITYEATIDVTCD